MNEYINWYYVGIYVVVALPILILLCRGIDTEASKDLIDE